VGRRVVVEIRPAGWMGAKLGPYARAVMVGGRWHLTYLRPGMEKWRERLLRAFFSGEPAPPELAPFSSLLSLPRETAEEVMAANEMLLAFNMEAVILEEGEA